MGVHDDLYDKLSDEYGRFIDEIKMLKSEQVINKAYEMVIKEDILACFFESKLSEDEARALLALDFPLDELYGAWMQEDDANMDAISDCIVSHANTLVADTTEHIHETVSETISTMPTATAINGEVKPGDWVVATGNSDYRYLVGMVTGINKLGTPEHDAETANDTDSVHVDFACFEYPPDRIAEIEQRFSALHGRPMAIDEVALDDVIMAPDMLISLTGMNLDEIANMGQSQKYCQIMSELFVASHDSELVKQTELFERLDKNLTDYQESLTGFGKRELIEMADKIGAVSDVYNFLSLSHGFSDEELAFYLQFQNPLEVVADAWCAYKADYEGMDYVLGRLYESRFDLITEYPLTRDAAEVLDKSLRRFMDIDVTDFLGKIAEKVIIHHPGDFDIDRNALFEAATSHNPDEQRLIWHVCSFGTHLNPECDVFIKDTDPHNCMTGYRQDDPDMFGYVVEVTGRIGQSVRGNVFEVGSYSEYAKHICDVAEPLESLTLIYERERDSTDSGKTANITRMEFDNDRNKLLNGENKLAALVYHPMDKVRLAALLSGERSRRMSLPKGSQEEHLRKLTDKLAVIRKRETPPPERAATPATPKKKPSMMARLAEADAEAKAYNAQRAQNNNTVKKQKEID